VRIAGEFEKRRGKPLVVDSHRFARGLPPPFERRSGHVCVIHPNEGVVFDAVATAASMARRATDEARRAVSATHQVKVNSNGHVNGNGTSTATPRSKAEVQQEIPRRHDQ